MRLGAACCGVLWRSATWHEASQANQFAKDEELPTEPCGAWLMRCVSLAAAARTWATSASRLAASDLGFGHSDADGGGDGVAAIHHRRGDGGDAALKPALADAVAARCVLHNHGLEIDQRGGRLRREGSFLESSLSWGFFGQMGRNGPTSPTLATRSFQSTFYNEATSFHSSSAKSLLRSTKINN